MAANDLVIPPPTPKLLDYPASIGLVVAVVLTALLLVISGRFDPTGGTLTISLLVILAFLSLVTYCAFFTIPTDEITSGAIGGLVAAFGAVVAYWLGRNKQDRP
jgi:FtsH-binding integral membrane protein